MNAVLCERLGGGAFPIPAGVVSCSSQAGKLAFVVFDITRCTAEVLAAGLTGLQACGVGYRAKTLLKLAQQVRAGLQLLHCCAVQPGVCLSPR